MRKALIFGGQGQDGIIITNYLIKKEYKVISVSRNKKKKIANPSKNLICKKCDISESKKVFKIIKNFKPDEIYNFAAVSTIQQSEKNIIKNDRINCFAILKIYEFLKKIKYKGKFFQSLSAELFGNYNKAKQVNFKQFDPQNPYAIAKLNSYFYSKYYREKFNLKIYCGFFFNHDSIYKKKNHLIPTIVKGFDQIIKNKIKYFNVENTSSLRDWNLASDFMPIVWKKLNNEKPHDFILRSSQYNSVEDIIFAVAKYHKIKLKKKIKGKKIFFVNKITNRKIIISKNIKNKLIINKYYIKDIKLKKKNKISRIVKNLH